MDTKPATSSYKRFAILWVASTVALGLILGTYPLYADPLFDESYETLIPNIQERNAGKENGGGWSFFSNLAIFSVSNGPIVIILGNNPNRAEAFYFVIVYVFQVCLVGYL